MPLPQSAEASVNASGGLINVNTALLEELTAHPCIGSSDAPEISAEWSFVSVEELEWLPGIGSKTLAPLVKVRD